MRSVCAARNWRHHAGREFGASPLVVVLREGARNVFATFGSEILLKVLTLLLVVVGSIGRPLQLPKPTHRELFSACKRAAYRCESLFLPLDSLCFDLRACQKIRKEKIKSAPKRKPLKGNFPIYALGKRDFSASFF